MPHTDQEFREHVIASLSRLETNMQSLVGNGQPGRMTRLEDRVGRAEKVMYGGWGAAIVVGFLLKIAPYLRGLL